MHANGNQFDTRQRLLWSVTVVIITENIQKSVESCNVGCDA
jgi:hypothetical protein